MKKIKDFEFKNKKVLVREDFNVPQDKEGNILDNFRIESSLPTIEYLKKQKARIILMSHLNDPLEEKNPQKYTLKPIAKELEKILKTKIKFLSDCVGKKVEEEIKKMKPGEICLLENLRFHKEETSNNSEFSKNLAKLGDIFINDAFSTCHRAHASIVGITKFLPKAAGLSLEKEINALSKIKEKPRRPLVVIMGGKKSAKIESLHKFLEMADFILLNGFLSLDILMAKGILIVDSLSPEKEIVEVVKDINLTNPKIHLPKDVIFSLKDDWSYRRIGGLGTIKKEEEIFDIGPETIDIYSEIVKKAGTIFLAGPLGYFEVDKFENGTREVGEKIVRNYKAFKFAGGGDTIVALRKFKWLDKFDYISTGGSAMLQYLSGEKLPGIEALE